MTGACLRSVGLLLALICFRAPECWAEATRVTSEVLLEHVRTQTPEVAAMSGVAWAERGRRIVFSVTAHEVPPAAEGDRAGAPLITSVDTRSGAQVVIGRGSRVTSALNGDGVAYFPSGANEQQVALARASGAPICVLNARELMPSADRIQSFALSDDGKRLALAIGSRAPSTPGNASRPASVRVLGGDAGHENAAVSATLWTTDLHCHGARKITEVAGYRVGRLAWAAGNREIVAVAATFLPDRTHPRSDLLLFNLTDGAWRTLVPDIGEQARAENVGFLQPAPESRHVAFLYDADGLPYQLRKQLAIVSLDDGKLRVISRDPRHGAGWLDSRTLLIGVSAAHELLSKSATLTLDGEETPTVDVPGTAVPSPSGREVAWLETDLYGSSTLRIAGIRRDASALAVRKPRILWKKPSPLARYARAERRFIECLSTDGVRPSAILVLPMGFDSQRRYPLIVDIHGGPRGGLSSPDLPYHHGAILTATTLEHDMWAAKGYAVLVPDYRGSGLYGFDRIPRDGSRFARDFDDILCNVDAAIREGIADPARLVAIGHSNGGEEVNWIVTHTHRFKAAISKEGSYHVNSMLAWGVSGRSNPVFTSLYGSPLQFPERYRQMSVMGSVVGVTTPTMFVAHDGGKRSAGLYPWLYAAWRAQGIEAQLRLYDEDRHTLSAPEHQRDILDASIDWIERHLKTVPH